jgi:hypothetical protein
VTTGDDKKPWTPGPDYDYDKTPAVRLEDGTYRCARPPVPWSCTREPGHEGPCAAIRSETVSIRPTMADIKEHTDMQPAFYLSIQQKDAASKWMHGHDKARHIRPGKTHRYSGAIGGAYTWCFTPTSLGTVVTVECSCGEKLDVSDYDW